MSPLGKNSSRIAPADAMVIDFSVKNGVVALRNRFSKLALKRNKKDPQLSSLKQRAAEKIAAIKAEELT